MPTITIDGVFFLALGLNLPAVTFLLKDYGDLVQRGFTILNGTTPGIQCSVVELFADEAILSADLNSFDGK